MTKLVVFICKILSFVPRQFSFAIFYKLVVFFKTCSV